MFEVVPVLNRDDAPPDTGRSLNVQLDFRTDDATFVAHGDEPQVGTVVGILDRRRGHFYLLNKLALISIHRVESVDHVMPVDVSRRIAERAEGIHGIECLLATPLKASIHALGLVHDNDGTGGPNQVDGFLAAGLLAVFVKVVDVLFVDGADRHDHDLNVGAGSEVAHLSELARIVEKVLEGDSGVEAFEMVLGYLDCLVDTLFDSDRGHHDNELVKAKALVQLKNRAQVHVGLAGAGLHLHGEVAGGECRRGRQAIANLDLVQVREDLIVEQVEAVANAKIVLGEGQPHLFIGRIHCDSELRAAYLLAAEQVADRLDGLDLVVKIGLELQSHRHASTPCTKARKLSDRFLVGSRCWAIFRAASIFG